MSNSNAGNLCPCGSGQSLTGCCEPIIYGSLSAHSAEALMRSRYTAHALQHKQHLLESWHPSTRPDSIDIDPATQWIRLKILKTDENHVEFIATYRIHGKAYNLHENSRFVFEDGNWFYIDGVIEE